MRTGLVPFVQPFQGFVSRFVRGRMTAFARDCCRIGVKAENGLADLAV